MGLEGKLIRGGKPAHLLVKDRILDEIRAGVFSPGDRLPSEPDLARMMGVSRMTANRSILALVADGWLTREKGRGTFVTLPPIETTRCAVVLPVDTAFAMDDPYFGALYSQLHVQLVKYGVQVELVRLRSHAMHWSVAPAHTYVAVDPPRDTIPELARLGKSHNANVVLLGTSWTHSEVSVVDSDNVLGGALAGTHLADLGHRRMLMVGACPNDTNTIDRIRGFKISLRARGLPFNPERDLLMMDEATGIDAATATALAQRLTGTDRPTAVFAAGPKIAFHLLGLLQQLGLTCPRDVSVVGYDDPDLFELANPPLTTIRQPLPEMAQAVCDLVVANHAGNGDPMVFDPTLILRGSTAPVDPCSGPELP